MLNKCKMSKTEFLLHLTTIEKCRIRKSKFLSSKEPRMWQTHQPTLCVVFTVEAEAFLNSFSSTLIRLKNICCITNKHHIFATFYLF